MSVEEMQGWPIEIVTPDDFTPQRRLLVPWSQRLTEAAVLDDLEYPYIPGCGAFPRTIRIEPFDAQSGSPSETATYSNAVITIDYSSKWATEGAITEMLEPTEGNENRTVGGLLWSANNPIDPRTLSPILRQGATFHHIRRKLAIVPPTCISQQGYVNSVVSTSLILGITFAVGTLLAGYPSISRTWATGGLTSYSVHQRFRFRSNGGLGWNSQFNPTTGAYSYIYNSAGTRIYDYPSTNLVLV